MDPRAKNLLDQTVQINPGDIVIDCGANIGTVTDYFINRGAEVYAFEPNIDAFNILNLRFKENPNVKCIQKGVSSSKRCGMMKLYFHNKVEADSEHSRITYSQGCSTMADKHNVNESNYTLIELVDLSEVIRKINSNIKVLKVDIEGAECDLLNDLIEQNLINDIPYVFVETHEKKVPSMRKDLELLKKKIKDLNLTNINLNWI
jgi:FkbM family methyltransferase